MARATEGGRADGLPGFAVVQPRDCTFRRRLSAFGAGRSTDAGRHGDPSSLRSIADIEGAFAARAREDAGGIIIINDTFLVERRQLITEFAMRYRLPTIYAVQIYVPSGGLISYAADYPDILRRAASYVDRILRGVRPGDLPVQEPAKFTLSINLKAARAIAD